MRDDALRHNFDMLADKLREVWAAHHRLTEQLETTTRRQTTRLDMLCVIADELEARIKALEQKR